MEELFDNLLGNPPFQNSKDRKKTPHKLWIEFTEKAFTWLKPGGNLGWVTPQSWGSPSNKVLKFILNKETKYLNLDTKQYFPDIGSTFSHYMIVNAERTSPTRVVKDGEVFMQDFDDSYFYIPNDFCKESLGIHNKVMFSTDDKFAIERDYVTCHNVIRHAHTKWEKKIKEKEERLVSSKELSDKIALCSSLMKLLESKPAITVSENKTEEHIYPVFHTNNKTWYSSITQPLMTRNKVMWSRSGYLKAFYDAGTLGMTDLGYCIFVENETQGRVLADYLNSRLMQYVFKTAKWSGFGNERVFEAIPRIPLEKSMDDQELYQHFGITEEEQAYIETIMSPRSRGSKSTNKKSETKSLERVKELGEVYTPAELVNAILDEMPSSIWTEESQTFLDPSCGNGNFLIETYKRRVSLGISPESALRTIYGIDICDANVRECRERLLKYAVCDGLDARTAESIVVKNVAVGDTLKKEPFEILKEQAS